MTSYTAPTTDLQFVLQDVLQASAAKIGGYDELSAEFTAAVLEEAGKIASEVLAPVNATGDSEGCTLENGVVRTPTGFKQAFDALRDGGWTGLDCDPDYGGQGMPYLMQTAVGEMLCGANHAFSLYHGLTHAAYTAIYKHGSEQQKQTYLPKLVSCEWGGTMNLTESQCGTDLGLIRTKAEPRDNGSYGITGEKIFISAGEHDLTENIIHLVLARTPDAPEGTKGLSLFIVPKFLINDDGTLGDRNSVKCTKLEKKMGIHAAATCVMNYDKATGFLLGEENDGMRAMFTMMNEARIGVGLQGLGQAVLGYQNAATYARERLQGRDVTGAQNPDGPADPLIVHPDVRRMLMNQKSFVEGARALILWGAMTVDEANRNEDAAAEGMISLLTPVIKGFVTDIAFDMTVQAQQVFGGYGYIEETGVSQIARDARIAMIYEGANGVQALDLVGRKLPADGGKHMMAFFEIVKDFIAENKHNPALNDDFLTPLKQASKDLQAAAMYFVEKGMKDPKNALAGSHDFMHLLGHVCLGLMWARMARIAQDALEARSGDPAFYETKLATRRYYMARWLPMTGAHLARIRSGADTVMALPAEAF
jgi:alkylation response protein AidB-like acyl-CoA dehydrogenase